MNLEIFILNGYGHFVWPAFLFTFLSCLFLYLQTKKELRKQEKIFSNHFNASEVIKIEVAKQKESEKRVLSSKPILQ